jgi:hypothetical protein
MDGGPGLLGAVTAVVLAGGGGLFVLIADLLAGGVDALLEHRRRGAGS